MFTAPFINATYPSYAVGDAILPRDAQQQVPVFRHTCIKYLAPCACRFAVRRPVDLVKLGHLLFDDIDRISGLARPTANFGYKKNPTCTSHPSTTFPHLLTIFGSIAQRVNINRGSFATFCKGMIEIEVKSECFLHNQFTFYPHPTSGKYGFQNPRRCRWVGCNKESSWGVNCCKNHCSNRNWKWSEYFLHPKPRYIPIPPKTKGRFARTQNGRNNKSPAPLPGLPNNAFPAPFGTSSRRNYSRNPPPSPDTLLSMSKSGLRRKIRVLQKNQDTHITKLSNMKAYNKHINRDYNDKDAIIQSLKADTSKIIATSPDENNNRIKAMSNLHWSDIFMKDRKICGQAKELQE